MHAAILDKHHIAGFPLDALAIVDVMAAALDDEEAGGIEVSVLLAIRTRCIGLDMAFDGLRDLGGSARSDRVLTVEVRATLPRHAFGRDYPRRFQQLPGEVAVGALQ